MPDEYDSPWKEALDAYFEQCLGLMFPDIRDQLDWSRGYESLDKEFQQIVREAELGRRYVDKLFKVWTKDGAECWVLIHIEVLRLAAGGVSPKPVRLRGWHSLSDGQAGGLRGEGRGAGS